jgi:hypothetical protein
MNYPQHIYQLPLSASEAGHGISSGLRKRGKGLGKEALWPAKSLGGLMSFVANFGEALESP